MKYDIAGLDLALKTLINEFYPYTDSFCDGLYTLDDVVHQLIFEIIKEEYKQYAPKKTVMDFLGDYDVDGSNRKYTRTLQYAQHYRDHDNDLIENELGMRVPELEAQDMSGAKVFKGHQFTSHEFLGLKLQAECRLLNKFHEGQIRFFFQHSTVEIDGMSRKAKIKYHGPNGWNLSVDTSFDPGSQLGDGSEVLEQWQD